MATGWPFSHSPTSSWFEDCCERYSSGVTSLTVDWMPTSAQFCDTSSTTSPPMPWVANCRFRTSLSPLGSSRKPSPSVSAMPISSSRLLAIAGSCCAMCCVSAGSTKLGVGEKPMYCFGSPWPKKAVSFSSLRSIATDIA